MAEIKVRIAIDLPNWAKPYIASVNKRLAAGENIDVAAVAKLIQAFANYRIS